MRLHLPAPADFSFLETVSAHGWRWLPPFVWREETKILERVEALPDGNVILMEIGAANGGVSVTTERESDAEEIAQRVRRMLQMDVNLEEFHAFCRENAALCSIADAGKGRMLRCSTLFEDVVKVIATTNTTWAQTQAMTARLVEHFGAPTPEDSSKRAFPTPERIAAIPFDAFAEKARLGYRAASVYELASKIGGGELDLEGWQSEHLTVGELQKRLSSLRGIGPYGAACLRLYLGRPEAVNADSWARALVGRELGRVVSDKDVHEFFASHGVWRGLIYTFYPWRGA